jgi:hypothetical protein
METRRANRTAYAARSPPLQLPSTQTPALRQDGLDGKQSRYVHVAPIQNLLLTLSDRTPGLLCSCASGLQRQRHDNTITPTSLRRTGRASLDAPSSTGQHIADGETAPLARLVARFAGGADRLEDAHHSRPNAISHDPKWSIGLSDRMTTLWQGDCLAKTNSLPYQHCEYYGKRWRAPHRGNALLRLANMVLGSV